MVRELPRKELAAALRAGTVDEKIEAAFRLHATKLRASEIDALRQALHDHDPIVRDQAAATLGGAGDEAAASLIVSILDIAPPRESRGAAWAIAQLAIQAPSLRQVAVEALARYRLKARGRSRQHADALIAKVNQEVAAGVGTPR